MILAFQIVVLIIVLLSALGAFAEEDIQFKQTLASICIAGMVAEIVTFLLF